MDIQSSARRYAQTILGGTVLAVDPASGGSSDPGYSLIHHGVKIASGTVPLLKSGLTQHRLKLLYFAFAKYAPVDVLVIEAIKGRKAHQSLVWACGVIVAAIAPPVVLQMPATCWHRHVGKDHVKTDENDAIAIGETIVAMAEGRYGR